MKQIWQRFTMNQDGFWRKWKVFIAIFIVALLADAASTIYFMRHEGVDAELHPMVYLVSRWFGPVVGPLIGATGKAICGVIVAIYWRQIAGIIFGLVSLVSFWAAWFNLWGHRVYEPAINMWWPF